MSPTYAKDSMDRFGDDLCEYIVSYLTLEEAFRYECVSKQWRRVVFNGQHCLKVERFLCKDFDPSYGRLINDFVAIVLSKYETIFRKCRQLKNIEINSHVTERYREEVFGLIHKYCTHLVSIKSDLGLSAKTWNNFCDKFSAKLKSLIVYDSTQLGYHVFRHLPNLQEVNLQSRSLSVIVTGEEVLLTKLRSFSFSYSPTDFERVMLLCNENRNTLRNISLCSDNERLIPGESLDCPFKVFFSLPNLEFIRLDIRHVSVGNESIELLAKLSRYCPKLKSITLYVMTSSSANNIKVLKTFNSFVNLKRLDLFFNNKDSDGSENQFFTSESLQNCRHLTHLWFRTLNGEISDKFFTDIDVHWPQLQSIDVDNCQLTNSGLESLSKLSNLERISIFTFKCKHKFSELVVMDLIAKCRKLKRIYLSNGKQTIDLNDTKLLQLRGTVSSDCDIKLIKLSSLRAIDCSDVSDSDGFLDSSEESDESDSTTDESLVPTDEMSDE